MSLIVCPGLAQGYTKGLKGGRDGCERGGIPLQNPQAIVTQAEITDEFLAKQAGHVGSGGDFEARGDLFGHTGPADKVPSL